MSGYRIVLTSHFKKDIKVAKRRGYDMRLIEKAGEELEAKYRDHKLAGNYAGCRECHITPDWLLIYERFEDELILYLTRTGTHSDVF